MEQTPKIPLHSQAFTGSLFPAPRAQQPPFTTYLYNLCVVNAENISNVSHYCDTNSGLRQGSSLKDPSLCWEQGSFVPACFRLRCPLLVNLQYCRAAQRWYFSSTMMVFVTNLLGKPVWILTSMPSDPGVPEGPGGPGWPWGPGGPLWNTDRKTF